MERRSVLEGGLVLAKEGVAIALELDSQLGPAATHQLALVCEGGWGEAWGLAQEEVVRGQWHGRDV